MKATWVARAGQDGHVIWQLQQVFALLCAGIPVTSQLKSIVTCRCSVTLVTSPPCEEDGRSTWLVELSMSCYFHVTIPWTGHMTLHHIC